MEKVFVVETECRPAQHVGRGVKVLVEVETHPEGGYYEIRTEEGKVIAFEGGGGWYCNIVGGFVTVKKAA